MSGSKPLNGQSAVNGSPAASTPTEATDPQPDPILKSAWELLIQYDTAALQLKGRHIRYRAAVLLLSFIASLLAVGMGYLRPPDRGQFLELYPALFFALPLGMAILIVWLSSPRPGIPRRASKSSANPSQINNRPRPLRRLNRRIRAWFELHHRTVNIAILIAGGSIGLLLAALGLAQGPDHAKYEMLRLLLFGLPLVSAGIMAYVTKFLPSQLWSKYRYAAEAIRREIFLYRMNAGENYFNLPREQQQENLLKKLYEAECAADMPVTIFVPPIFNQERFKRALQEESGDDGYRDMAADDYIRLRLVNQYRWYTDKSFYEYRVMGRWQVVALVIGGAGSLLAYLGYEAWVAVTTSAAVTVSALANLMMYGRTYVIYHVAAQQLRQHYNSWNAKTAEYRMQAENISTFVASVETIFKNEINQWQQQAQDALEQADLEARDSVDKTPNGKSALDAFGLPKPAKKPDKETASEPEAPAAPPQEPVTVDITRSDQRPPADEEY